MAVDSAPAVVEAVATVRTGLAVHSRTCLRLPEEGLFLAGCRLTLFRSDGIPEVIQLLTEVWYARGEKERSEALSSPSPPQTACGGGATGSVGIEG